MSCDQALSSVPSYSDSSDNNTSTFTPSPSVDFLASVPKKYHHYSSVFLLIEVKNLPSYRSAFDTFIDINAGKTPLFSPMYYFSHDECSALFDYIETNLCKSFIQCSSSSVASSVLFI